MSARAKILACLRANPACTSSFVAYDTGLSFGDAQCELSRLIHEGLVSVGRTEDSPVHLPSTPLYRLTPETIGSCDICGRTDHHLIDDVCPACRPKAETVSARAPRSAWARSPGFCACAEDDEL